MGSLALRLGIDAALTLAAFWAALLLRFDGLPDQPFSGNLFKLSPAIVGVFLVAALLRGVYGTLPRYASVRDLLRLAEAVAITSGILVGLSTLGPKGTHLLPFSVPIIAAPIGVLLLGGARLRDRLARTPRQAHASDGRDRVLVVGAGDAGEMVARDMLRNTRSPFVPVAFVDDDPLKQHQKIHGVPILGKIDDLPGVVDKTRATTVLVAMPSASSTVIRRTLDKIAESGARPKIVPAIHEIVGDRITTADIRDVDVSDLIGREPIPLLTDTISSRITERTVLVTGAAGSIGSELCRQILRYGPRSLLLLDNDETEVYELWHRLSRVSRTGTGSIEMVVADVRDRARVTQVFETYEPDIVFHAAAHKHVAVMETHPAEAVLTNVLGTQNVAAAAAAHDAERFVLVSTDKAVAPSSVMGATKRLAELIVAYTQQSTATVFASVRFGNVLGSRGSVVPIFTRQIAQGGPITVTHAEATRYFMTIDEAASLIIQAAALATGGETFLLDMGEPVRILDLAEKMRAMLSPGSEDRIQIVFTGLRPGEKLHEELSNPGEEFSASIHPSISWSLDGHAATGAAVTMMKRLIALAERHGDAQQIRDALFAVAGRPREIRLDEQQELPAG